MKRLWTRLSIPIAILLAFTIGGTSTTAFGDDSDTDAAAGLQACATSSLPRDVLVGASASTGTYATKKEALEAAQTEEVNTLLTLRLIAQPFWGTFCGPCAVPGACVGSAFTVDDTNAAVRATVSQNPDGTWCVTYTVVASWTVSNYCSACQA